MNEHESQKAFAQTQQSGPQQPVQQSSSNRNHRTGYERRPQHGGRHRHNNNRPPIPANGGGGGHPIPNRFEYILGQLIASGVYLGRDTPADDSADIDRMLQVAQEINEKIGAYYTRNKA